MAIPPEPTAGLNRTALSLPADSLVPTLLARNEEKKAVQEQRNRTFGEDRVHIGSYMENIGWPGLLGYNMNRFLSDAPFALETELRQRLFWLDNSLHDGGANLTFQATVGMYYDITLFGQIVTHEADGVPQFQPHPLAGKPDLVLLPPFDFFTSGEMPKLHRMYRDMCELNRTRYGGQFAITFPAFGRGPLDVAIQLRTFDRFIEDVLDRPQFVHDLLSRIVETRVAYNRERRRFLGETPPAQPTTGIDDDWINIPLISPQIIHDFALPAYRQIAAAEGKVTHFHTCGRLEPVCRELLDVFDGITSLDVSGWNDFEYLDSIVPPDIQFALGMKNSFVLTGTSQQHRDLLARISRLTARRKVWLCAQAIVKLLPTYEENLAAMNRFIHLARTMLSPQTR